MDPENGDLQNVAFEGDGDFGGEGSIGYNLELDSGEQNEEHQNPLGLTDQDLQLQYDEVQSGAGAADENPSTPADTSTGGGQVDANDLFGSDHSDVEDGDGNQAAQRAEQPSGSGANAAGNDSDGGSIKSEQNEPSDFDVMMAKKSEERRRAFKRRKKQDVDLISDHDDRIKVLIDEMKSAAESDRRSKERGELAIKKLTMLPRVMNILRKHDLQTALLDLGILNPLADWLGPLNDGTLPHLKIRESLLKVLQEMPGVTPEQLKNSGIGKAVMFLYKHPKELKENRTAAGKLIQEWSRPIFGSSANYHSLSREEREDRDRELLEIRRRSSVGGGSGSGAKTSKKRRNEDEDSQGEEGDDDDPNKECPRARVPQPSLRDYVKRPKSGIQLEATEQTGRRSGPKPQNRFAKRIRNLQEQQKGVKKGGHVSLEGRKL